MAAATTEVNKLNSARYVGFYFRNWCVFKFREIGNVLCILCFFSPLCFIRHRWICIYPAYINSKKTRQEGRRLRKDQCVENPTYQEIKDVLSTTNLNYGIENKLYPREKSKVKSSFHLDREIGSLQTHSKPPSKAHLTMSHWILIGIVVSWTHPSWIEKRWWHTNQCRVWNAW